MTVLDEAGFLRFQSKIANSPASNCWMWTAGGKSEYGGFYFKGKIHAAHRIAYRLYKGPIPSGLVLDHTCMIKRCVNPSHLRAVTPRVNSTENILGTKRKAQREKTHCKRGHEFTEANTRVTKVKYKTWEWTSRACKTCGRMQSKNYRIAFLKKYRAID